MIQAKYRGYDVEDKVWRYGYYVCHEDTTYCCYPLEEEKKHHLIIWDSMTDWNLPNNWYSSEVNGDSVGQSTGMRDKHKKEIFGGDIVSAWWEGIHAIGVVKQRIDGLWIIYLAYQSNKFWGLMPDKNGKTTVKVIGNIYENPELIREVNNK